MSPLLRANLFLSTLVTLLMAIALWLPPQLSATGAMLMVGTALSAYVGTRACVYYLTPLSSGPSPTLMLAHFAGLVTWLGPLLAHLLLTDLPPATVTLLACGWFTLMMMGPITLFTVIAQNNPEATGDWLVEIVRGVMRVH